MSAFGITLLTLITAYGNYDLKIFLGYFTHPVIFLLNLLPILLFELLLYFITGRAWISFLTTSAVFVTASVGNYFKLLFRDDPFMFTDITAISTAMGVAGNYDISIDIRVFVDIVCIIFGTLFLFLFVRGRLKPSGRIAGTVLMLACFYPVGKLMLNDSVYTNTAANSEYINIWSSTQTYISKGFVYPFFHSANNAFDIKPDSYDKNEVEALLAQYENSDISEDRKVNIISIQLEAFSDFTKMGVEGISPDVYELYHQIEDESYHGTLVTNIFAGGTVDTERCFITGFSELRDFRRSTNSYMWYLQDQGYFTTGSHSCYCWFYNRLNINEWLGISSYHYQEDYYGALCNDGIAYDDIMIPEILSIYYNDILDSSPVFSFNVTYQGHGPYGTNWLQFGDGYWDAENCTDETWYIFNNYLGSVKNTSENLWDMLSELRDDDTPVVVVLYGDHKPWLGDGNSAYIELGVNLDTSTEDGFYNYYSTDYVFWANDAAKAITGNDFTGEGETISANYLMNLLFEQLGWEGSGYMKYTDELRQIVPVVNTKGYYMENGQITTDLSESAAQAVEQYKNVEYYMRNNFLYEDK